MRKPDFNDPKYRQDPSVPVDKAVRGWEKYANDMARWKRQTGARIYEAFTRRGVVKTPAFWGGYNVLHRSTKTPGRFQLSFFDENMEPWGDTERDNPRELIQRMLEEMPSKRR